MFQIYRNIIPVK